MLADFRTFLLVDEAKAPPTVDRMIRRLDMATNRWDFNLKRYTENEALALEEGRAYLTRRRPLTTTWAYNSDVKLLSALSRWRGYEHDWRYLRAPRARYRALGAEQVDQLFGYRIDDKIAEKMHRALLLVALKTGMRASEIASMNVSDLDQERSRILVRKPAKGGMRRWIPVERWMWSKTRPLTAWLRARPVPKNDPDALWTTRHKSGNGAYTPGHDPARRCSSDYLRNCLYRVGIATGVPVNFNVTRHTRATELRARGWDLLYIKEYLGHASVKSTEIYAEVRDEDVERMMRKRPGRDFFNDTEEE